MLIPNVAFRSASLREDLFVAAAAATTTTTAAAARRATRTPLVVKIIPEVGFLRASVSAWLGSLAALPRYDPCCLCFASPRPSDFVCLIFRSRRHGAPLFPFTLHVMAAFACSRNAQTSPESNQNRRVIYEAACTSSNDAQKNVKQAIPSCSGCCFAFLPPSTVLSRTI